MAQRCQLAQCLTVENGEQQTCLPVAITKVQAVAMRQIEHLAVEFDRCRFVVYNHPALSAQVVQCPHVVVSGKEMHFHSVVGEFRQFSEETGKAARHYRLIFKPEVEHIAKHIHSLSFVLYLVKEIHQPAFLRAVMF